MGDSRLYRRLVSLLSKSMEITGLPQTFKESKAGCVNHVVGCNRSSAVRSCRLLKIGGVLSFNRQRLRYGGRQRPSDVNVINSQEVWRETRHNSIADSPECILGLKLRVAPLSPPRRPLPMFSHSG